MTMLLGITNSDGFAISMIAILGVSFSFVLVLIVGIIRQTRKESSQADELIEEICSDEPAQPAGNSSEKSRQEPWERKSDWWKQDS